MADLIVELLSRDQIRSVFPLIREAAATIDLSTWMRFARQLTAPRRAGQCGIVTARRESRTFPCGLFCFRVEDDLTLGKVLTADHFVAVDLLDPDAVLAALVQELDVLAKRLGCAAVRSLVHGGAPTVAGGLYAAGHRPEGATPLVKKLPADPRCDDPAPQRATQRMPSSVMR
jgi:hypothetical protein